MCKKHGLFFWRAEWGERRRRNCGLDDEASTPRVTWSEVGRMEIRDFHDEIKTMMMMMIINRMLENERG